MSTCEHLESTQPGCLNISLLQGDPQEVRLHFEAPFVLDDFDPYMDIKRQINSPSTLIKKVVGSGLDIDGNTLIVSFNEDFLRCESTSTYHYDIAFKEKATGNVFHLIKGKILLTPTITRP